jgi:hypothetical protein
VDAALVAGHQVIAYTRQADAIQPRPGWRSAPERSATPESCRKALAGSDAVLCALGGRPWRRTEHVCTTATQAICR